MQSDISNLFSAINVPGVRQALAGEVGIEALRVGKFHAAFAALTREIFSETNFRQFATNQLASGDYLELGMLKHFAQCARYAREGQPHHRLLADIHSYQLTDRPTEDGRSWYTQLERSQAALICAKLPLIPLSHMCLFSLANQAIVDLCMPLEGKVGKGDMYSYLLRWSPENTTGDFVPAVSIMLVHTLKLNTAAMQMPLEEFQREILTHDFEQYIESAFKQSKDFLFDGGFFNLRLVDEAGKTVKVSCPGKDFMASFWDLHYSIYQKLVADFTNPYIQKWCANISDVYRRAVLIE